MKVASVHDAALLLLDAWNAPAEEWHRPYNGRIMNGWLLHFVGDWGETTPGTSGERPTFLPQLRVEPLDAIRVGIPWIEAVGERLKASIPGFELQIDRDAAAEADRDAALEYGSNLEVTYLWDLT